MSLAALFMWFLAVFPWENQEPEQERLWDPALMEAAVVVSVLALDTFVAVAVDRRRWAIRVAAVDLTVGLAVLSSRSGNLFTATGSSSALPCLSSCL